MSFASDYQQRATANNFADPMELKAALVAQGTVVLDVRTDEEIATGKVETPDQVSWTKTGCSRTECPALASNPAQFVPTKDTTVVVHCKSGARANRAKIVLEELGYTKVLNGGGLIDMVVYPTLM